MLRRLEFKILFLTLILLPILKGGMRTILFGIAIIIGSHFIISDLVNKKYKLSLKKEDIQGRLLISSIILIAYFCINVVLNGFSYSVLERIIQLYACLSVLIVSSIYEWSEKDYKFCINVIRIVMLSCLFLYPMLSNNKNYYSGIYTSGNSLGGVIFCYLGIYLAINRKYSMIDKFIILSSLILMYLSKCRATLIALVLFIILRYFFTRKIVNKKKLLLYSLIIFLTVFPVIYVNIYNSDFRIVLNNLSRNLFNKNFFSGRQITWEYLIEAIENNILIGYGLDMAPETITGLHLSSHNWYIQILLQVGLIGYLLIINILHIIWSVLNIKKESFTSLSVSAFMIGMLVWQCFEVVLTQNNIYIGISIWFVLGMGINTYIEKFNK